MKDEIKYEGNDILVLLKVPQKVELIVVIGF